MNHFNKDQREPVLAHMQSEKRLLRNDSESVLDQYSSGDNDDFNAAAFTTPSINDHQNF